jgi:hypothetical protein
MYVGWHGKSGRQKNLDNITQGILQRQIDAIVDLIGEALSMFRDDPDEKKSNLCNKTMTIVKRRNCRKVL